MWDAIQITYEGIKDVQLRKATTLMRHYEIFTMKQDETIDEIATKIVQFGGLYLQIWHAQDSNIIMKIKSGNKQRLATKSN
ncbi:hypothetical protein CR513_06979, partial [Mucuna pruriens]